MISLLAILASASDENRPIVSDKISVEAGHYVYWSFQVPQGQYDLVQGRFPVIAGRDVEAYIFDRDGFENFSNGTKAKTWYNSGRVTVDSPNVALKPGQYYLVFSNKFSLVTNKLVEVDIRQRRGR
jgi:hypothetical protein